MGEFSGKVALVTGAADGIGLATVNRLSTEGATVVGVDIDRARIDECRGQFPDSVSWLVADVSLDDVANDYVVQTLGQHGTIDLAVLNAGIAGRLDSIENLSVAEFDRVLAVNVRGVWLALSKLMRSMREAGGGAITITSSVGAFRGTAGYAPYAMSKHALVGLMKTAALEGAPHAIRVNSVHPGPTDTRMLDGIRSARDANRVATTPSGGVPLARMAEPAEVANMILFLLSAKCGFCTGGTYLVDGGITAGG